MQPNPALAIAASAWSSCCTLSFMRLVVLVAHTAGKPSSTTWLPSIYSRSWCRIRLLSRSLARA
jgi:hypothetical protein